MKFTGDGVQKKSNLWVVGVSGTPELFNCGLGVLMAKK